MLLGAPETVPAVTTQRVGEKGRISKDRKSYSPFVSSGPGSGGKSCPQPMLSVPKAVSSSRRPALMVSSARLPAGSRNISPPQNVRAGKASQRIVPCPARNSSRWWRESQRRSRRPASYLV